MLRDGLSSGFQRSVVDLQAAAARGSTAATWWQASNPDRAALTGILFVLRTGIRCGMLPLEMGCGSGITCCRRLRDWQEAGVWDGPHRKLLRRLRAADKVDWSHACMDSASVVAKRG
jgi:transposase